MQNPEWRNLLPKAALNDAQIRNVSNCTVQPLESLRRLKPITYHGLRAVAPGVVLIRAPGHTPGSRYVMSSGTHGDDRDAVFLQTIALKHLGDSSPDSTLVPGHDAGAIEAIIKAGLFKSGFSTNF